MIEYVYLYTPQGYSPGYVFRNFASALAMLLKDEGYDSVDDFIESLEENDVWYDIDDERFSVDDGPSIEKLELL